MNVKKEKSIDNKLPIFFNSLDIKGFRPANYDLRLGSDFFVSREKYPKRLSETDAYIVIEPGDFAILTTHEYIYVPDDLLGLISLRNTYKKYGLINISGFHVDPGYYGKLMFSVYNAGPEKVILKYKEPVFMIMYDKLEEPVLEGYGKEGFENITVDLISGLIGYSISPVRLKSRIDSLELQLKILLGIVIALLVALVAQILRN
jgi:dCTP deaminase